MFVALLLLACDDRAPGPSAVKRVDASIPLPLPVALTPENKTPDADADAESVELAQPCTSPSTGDKVWSAVGQAPKGQDLSLARQLASNRARKKLAELLKDQRILDGQAELPAGTTIARVWSRGKNIFAEVRWCNTPGPGGLNEPPKRPSNSVEVGNPLK